MRFVSLATMIVLALVGATEAQAQSAMAKKFEAGPAIAGNRGPDFRRHKMHRHVHKHPAHTSRM